MTHLTTDAIQAACRAHGTKIVSDAAYAAMTGNRAALNRCGLGNVVGLDKLHAITVVAHAMMAPEDAASDAAEAVIGLAQIKP